MRTVSVKSAARILDMLELLAGLPQGIRVNELARQLAMPKSSASSLVATLEGRGYVVAAADGYRLAERYRGTSWVGGPTATLVHESRPVMERLAATTGESAFLGIPTPQLDIRYVAKAVSDNPLRYDVDLVALRPAYCTSIGHAILAFLPERTLDRYFETHELVAVTSRTVTDEPAIRKAIAQARSRGYATIENSNGLGTSGIAAPVFSGERVVAALALIGPSARFDPVRKATIPVVVDAARRISDAISPARAVSAETPLRGTRPRSRATRDGSRP